LEERIQNLVSEKLEIEKSLDDSTVELATLGDEKQVIRASPELSFHLGFFICVCLPAKFWLIFYESWLL
jgi:hypothetical protein